MDLQLRGKRTIVTGASRGLGHATAVALAAEGCRVAISSRDPDRIAAAADAIGAHPVAADMADPAGPGDAVVATEAALDQATVTRRGNRAPVKI